MLLHSPYSTYTTILKTKFTFDFIIDDIFFMYRTLLKLLFQVQNNLLIADYFRSIDEVNELINIYIDDIVYNV